MNPEAIGKFISEERKAKGLTQKELGESHRLRPFRLCLPDRGDSLDHALFRRNNDLRNAPGYSVTYLHAILYCSLPCLLGQPWKFRQRGMPGILS